MPGGRKRPSTPGGQKLQALRKRLGLTLADVAAKTGDLIGLTHLQKIEAGVIRRPDRETLTAILQALDASYGDRRDVLEAFGYIVPHSLPTAQEIATAIELCAHELDGATYPIYLIDDGQRLLAWNRYVPRLIAMDPDDPALAQFVGVTTIDLAFNPTFPTKELIENPEEYLPMLLHFIKTGLQAYVDERWYTDLITYSRTLPGFSSMWDSVQGTTTHRVATQTIIPIKVNVPQGGLLQFRLSSTPFLLDSRFQLIHYTPFGARTLRQCALWAEEEGTL